MTIYSGFTHWKWWFSIVMLVNQRVYGIGNHDFGIFQTLKMVMFHTAHAESCSFLHNPKNTAESITVPKVLLLRSLPKYTQFLKRDKHSMHCWYYHLCSNIYPQTWKKTYPKAKFCRSQAHMLHGAGIYLQNWIFCSGKCWNMFQHQHHGAFGRTWYVDIYINHINIYLVYK